MAPVVHTTRAREFIEPENPFDVGTTGILGNRAGMEAVLDCDLLLCLGTDFAYTQFYPEKAKIVQVDIDPAHIGRRSPVHLGLVGDVGDTVDALLPRLAERDAWQFLDKALAQWEADREDYESRGDEPDESLIHPQFVAQTRQPAGARHAAEDRDWAGYLDCAVRAESGPQRKAQRGVRALSQQLLAITSGRAGRSPIWRRASATISRIVAIS